MKSKIVVGAIGAGVLAILSLAAFVYAESRDCQFHLQTALRVKAPMKLDRLSALELAAVREWARVNGIAPEAVLDGRDVRTLGMGDQTCVALLLERGAVGDNPVYCFDSSGSMVGRFEQDEQI